MTAATAIDIQNDKAQLRTRLKAARVALPEDVRSAASTAIVDRLLAMEAVNTARRVFVFISNGPEVHTHGLIRHFLHAGKEVAVPKILGSRQMIANRLRDWSGLQPAQLGILTPIATEPVEEPFDIVITPGLGFTAAGHRIGFGAGYYDRWFATHTVGCKIAVAFEVQVVPAVPTTATDIPVDAIATEERLIVVPASSLPG